jgi:hypothetical protein
MIEDMLSPQSPSIEPPRRDRIAAISGTVQRRPIVLVLGMHRSGTSLCSHILSALGVDMADEVGVNLGNDRGHWERWEIVEFHDRILRLFNRDYGGRFHDFAMPVAWWADPRVAEIRREIVAFLERRMDRNYFGLKDPRTMRLLPIWHQIFNELKLAPKFVLCLRNPAQVGRSLHARDGLDPVNGEYRWLVHMIDFYRYASNFDFCTVEYEEWFDNPAATIEKLQNFLDLPWQQSESDLTLVLSGIIDPTARHDDSTHREASQPLVRTLYKLAGEVGQDAAARDRIAYIVSQFIGFQQLQSPLLKAFEGIANTAAKYPAIEQEAAALRVLIDERDAALAVADSKVTAAEVRLVDATSELEGQRSQIADLARECDSRAEIEQELNRLTAMLAEREAALRRAEQEAQGGSAAALAMQSEIGGLRQTLAEVERAEQERAAAAAALQAEVEALRETLAKNEAETKERAAAAGTMDTEVRTLRERLAQADRETQQRAAAERRLQAEVVTLRGRLVEAEGEATERRTAAAALEVQVAMLRDTLTAAREVGRAAVSAFRVDIAAPAISHARRGRLQAVMKFLGA